MESLSQYLKIAKKILNTRNLSPFINNDLFIGEIAYALMVADHKYNPEIGNKEGYRKYYTDHHIRKLKRDYLKSVRNTVALTDELANNQIHYSKDIKSKDFLEFIKSTALTNQEKVIIYMMYWQNDSMESIGKKLSISRQRVHTVHNNALEKLRNELV